MSLVHESIIELLNLRFVSTYYNVYAGPGHDPQAKAFAEEIQSQANATLQYGAFISPDGKLISSFGYDLPGFVAALRDALKQHPEWTRPGPSEEAIFVASDENPEDVVAQLAAARLEGVLLRFESGRTRLARLLDQDLSDDDRIRVQYARAHLAAIDFDRPDNSTARKELTAISGLSPELEDDRQTDLLSLDVELALVPNFFGGWRLAKRVNIEQFMTTVEHWLDAALSSNRRGELLFYLGLARFANGDPKGADEVWTQHDEELPADRFAMLSRLHHSKYGFSPTSGNIPAGGSLSDPAVASQVTRLLAAGSVQVQGADGTMLSGEAARKYIEQFIGAGASAISDEGNSKVSAPDQPLPYNFEHLTGTETTPYGRLPEIEVVGDGPLQLLLIAGLGFEGAMTWREFAERNDARYTSHIVTLPGFGNTPPWPMPDHVEDFEEHTWTAAAEVALVEYAERESLDRPVVVGHHVTGAELAMRLALDHPGTFRGVVVISNEPSRALAGKTRLTLEQRAEIVAQKWQPFFQSVEAQTWSRGMYPPQTYSLSDDRAMKIWQSTDDVPVPTMVRWFLEYQYSAAETELESLRIPMLALAPRMYGPGTWLGLVESRDIEQLRVESWAKSDSAAFPMLDDSPWFDRSIGLFLESL